MSRSASAKDFVSLNRSRLSRSQGSRAGSTSPPPSGDSQSRPATADTPSEPAGPVYIYSGTVLVWRGCLVTRTHAHTCACIVTTHGSSTEWRSLAGFLLVGPPSKAIVRTPTVKIVVPTPLVSLTFLAGQKLKYMELQKEALRNRLKKDKSGTYTYSQAFQSMTVCLVNETEIAKKEAEEAKSRWTTQRGFVYPAPKVCSHRHHRHPHCGVAMPLRRAVGLSLPECVLVAKCTDINACRCHPCFQDPVEFRRPGRELSEARKAELRQPWEDPTLPPVPSAAGAGSPTGRPDFVVNPPRPDLFGFVDLKGTK
jgi:hypothetical protein